MYNLAKQHLHFIGIGGVGMAGIAEVLRNLGYSVSGSDMKLTPLTRHLEELGVSVFQGHSADAIPAQTTTVVVSSAIRADNPELISAKERNIPIIPRAEMLGELMRMKYGIAVAGAHGKTTTTTMIGKLLGDLNCDPTVIIGGRVLSQRSGARLGAGPFLVAESDESDGSFLRLRPAIAIVTNIDSEHLSHYGSFGALEEAFARFIDSVPFYGLVVACGDDPVVRKIAEQSKRRTVFYGLSPNNHISATDITPKDGKTSFTLTIGGEAQGTCVMPMPGIHMVSNSLAAAAVALELGGKSPDIIKALEAFPGVARRSEVLAEVDGIRLIDDYGHHPTEIRATIAAIRRGYLGSGTGKLRVVFQPHRYTRTHDLFTEFLSAFDEADTVFVSEVYAAGEDPIANISGELLAGAIQHPDITFVPELNQNLSRTIISKLRAGDVLLTLGAGSIGSYAHELARELSEHPPLRVVNQ